MESNIKLVFSGLAIALTFVAFVPYIRSILQGVTKPHVFSWVIWGTTTVVVCHAVPEWVGIIGNHWQVFTSHCFNATCSAAMFNHQKTE